MTVKPPNQTTSAIAAPASAKDVRGRLGGLLGGVMEMGLSAETKACRAQVSHSLRRAGI